MNDFKLDINEYLHYVIDGCIGKLKALEKINKQLRKALTDFADNSTDINLLGALNNALVTSIIVNISCLFDRDRQAASLYKVLKQKDVDNWRQQPLFSEIIKARDKFEAHKEIKFLEAGKWGLSTSFFTNSVIIQRLEGIKKLLPQGKPRPGFSDLFKQKR